MTRTKTSPAPLATLVGTLAGALVALAGTLTACSGADAATPDLTVTGAYIPEPLSGDMAAGFLTIDNAGDADDTLTSVTTDLAATVEMHETVDHAMRPVDSFPVPADGRLRLDRGGSHLMLLDLTRRPAQGDTATLELHFAESDPITLRVPIESATHTGEE
ncbi:copper chaperone PCu(A)C [Streptomyces sp. 6N223]|uniref:copper chaperone PCu(A)C n=1 Tax=Streptomyces sp. 6N223 TaxID=3457412 RepID=UPI003FD204E6